MGFVYSASHKVLFTECNAILTNLGLVSLDSRLECKELRHTNDLQNADLIRLLVSGVTLYFK